VDVDPAALGAALDAIVDNVFAHTPEGTAFMVCVTPGPGRTTVIAVEDEGPGLHDPALVARGHSGAGSTGLGLDIARRTAEMCGGKLTLGRSPTGGARVALELPES